jgi:REP element-mobilizing transposase RayT
MLPKRKIEYPGAIYHVIARGVDRRRIFVDDEDYGTYISLLATVVKRQGWYLLSYCLMPNHVHLLIETPDTNLANGMQWLHSLYARAFNRRHGRRGHLFEAPYQSPLVVTEGALIQTTGYIVANPIAASLCTRAAEWPWGSHAHVEKPGPVPRWLAHDRLAKGLDEAGGTGCYGEIVAARERLWAEVIQERREGSRAASPVTQSISLFRVSSAVRSRM